MYSTLECGWGDGATVFPLRVCPSMNTNSIPFTLKSVLIWTDLFGHPKYGKKWSENGAGSGWRVLEAMYVSKMIRKISLRKWHVSQHLEEAGNRGVWIYLWALVQWKFEIYTWKWTKNVLVYITVYIKLIGFSFYIPLQLIW